MYNTSLVLNLLTLLACRLDVTVNICPLAAHETFYTLNSNLVS
jgi:hypothetical protein